MKWFGNTEISANADERALQCVRYVLSDTERPEREATAMLLLDTLRKYELETETYGIIIKSGIKLAVSWCALNCKEDALEYFFNKDLTQETLAIIANNSMHSLPFLEKLLAHTDDSDRGIVNRKILAIRIAAARSRANI